MSNRVLIKCREPKNTDIVFIIHLYYIDMLDDLAVHIERARQTYDFDVVVSIPPEHESMSIVRRIVDKLDPVIIEGVDNKGKDVCPFLKTIHHLEPYTYACKIHTKNNRKEYHNYGSKSQCSMGPNPNNPYDSWRDDMWHSLMLPEKMAEALNALKNGAKAYAPDYLYLEPSKIDVIENADYIHQIGQIVGMELKSQRFIAGTMFWFNVQSLLWLKDYNWDDKFDSIGGNTGQMEHAFERVFAQLAEATQLEPESVEELVEESETVVEEVKKDIGIYTFMPYREGSESFVDTCNRFMELIPNDDDFAVLIDHDAVFTTIHWHAQLHDIIKRYPDVNAFCAMTNRIHAPCLWADVDRKTNDFAYHRQKGEEIAKQHWDEAFEFPPLTDKNRGIGGFFMMIRKSTWKKIGGFTCTLKGREDICYGMDWSLTHRLFGFGEKIYVAKGIYMYHWYGNFDPEDYKKGKRRKVQFSHSALFNMKEETEATRSNLFMKRIVIYTAIFGNKDKLIDPPVFDNVDYVCFTDNPDMKSDIWDVRIVEPTHEDPCRAAKIYKILPHNYFRDYEISLWLDGNIHPVISPHELLSFLEEDVHMACFRHPDRNCIYKEAQRCLKASKQYGWNCEDLINEQTDKYCKEGYPVDNGLVNGGVLLRRHHQPVIMKAMQDWWEEIERYSPRDQLSFNYVAHKNNLKYNLFNGLLYDKKKVRITRRH